MTGRKSVQATIEWDKFRESRYPEDKFRATVLGAGVLVPLSVLFSGLTIHFIDGTVGLVVAFSGLFMHGVGVRTTKDA